MFHMGWINLNGEIEKSDGLLIVSILAVTSALITVSSYDTEHAGFTTYILLIVLVLLITFSYRKYAKNEINFPVLIEQIAGVEASLRFNIDYESIGGVMKREIDYIKLIILCEKYRLLALNAEKYDLAKELHNKRIQLENEYLRIPVSGAKKENS